MDNNYSSGDFVNYLRAVGRALIRLKPHRSPGHVKLESLDRDSEKLLDVTIGARDELIRVNTVFPFTLFPDTIVIDREKLTIANRSFFRVAKINSVAIEDILSVQADVGPFFGSVRVSSRYFITNPQSVKFLWREDAIKIQRLLQGYIIVREKHIDCLKIDKSQLKTLLYDLGQGVSD